MAPDLRVVIRFRNLESLTKQGCLNLPQTHQQTTYRIAHVKGQLPRMGFGYVCREKISIFLCECVQKSSIKEVLLFLSFRCLRPSAPSSETAFQTMPIAPRFVSHPLYHHTLELEGWGMCPLHLLGQTVGSRFSPNGTSPLIRALSAQNIPLYYISSLSHPHVSSISF